MLSAVSFLVKEMIERQLFVLLKESAGSLLVSLTIVPFASIFDYSALFSKKKK